MILAFGRAMQIERYFMANSGYIVRQHLKKKKKIRGEQRIKEGADLSTKKEIGGRTRDTLKSHWLAIADTRCLFYCVVSPCH